MFTQDSVFKAFQYIDGAGFVKDKFPERIGIRSWMTGPPY
jgi:hypothetical protein